MRRASHIRNHDARRGRIGCARVCLAGLLALVAVAQAGAEGAGDRAADRGIKTPWVKLKLSDLGVPPTPQAFLNVGSSMLTLDVIDDTHLLLTFSSRGLVPRLPGASPEDDDRMVAAEVVELPSGKVLARTAWHMHDHARYLWRMGKGRFLVRSRDSLFVITPGALLNTPDPLRAKVFPQPEGTPVMAMISPESSLLMVETKLPEPKKAHVQTAATNAYPSGNAGPEEPKKADVMIGFYRLKGGDAPDSPLSVMIAGMVRSPALLALPVDGDGYLWPGDGKRDRWPVSFNEYGGGKEVPVGSVASSCPPRLQMLSRFEYAAFACQGADQKLKMQIFGMDGHENWEESLGTSFGTPAFAFAPDAGRFAISRIATTGQDVGLSTGVPDGSTQEMRVYQTESGDLLLRVPMSPVLREAETFDLSDDGQVAAVVNAGAVQVYKLPPPTDKDRKDLQEAASFAPPLGAGPVELTRLAKKRPQLAPTEVAGTDAKPESNPDAKPDARPEVKPAVETTAAPAKVETAAEAGSGAGASAGAPDGTSGAEEAPGARGMRTVASAAPDEPGAGGAGDHAPRKPPTLLAPGENAEYKAGGAKQSQQQ